jgi:uncharacterized repeat protein (TIGR01451 family)
MVGLPTALLPQAQANHVDASDFFAFAKAALDGAADGEDKREASEGDNAPNAECDSSNHKQVEISGATSDFFGRVHSNADLSISGAQNVFHDDPVTFGSNDFPDCVQNVDANNWGSGGVGDPLDVNEVATSPTGVGACGWPGNLGTFLNADCETIAFVDGGPGGKDQAFGLTCDIGDLNTSAHLVLDPDDAAFDASSGPGDPNGSVVCNGPGSTTEVTESGSNASNMKDITVTIISRGLVQFPGQFLDIRPAHFPLLVVSDKPASEEANPIKLNGSNTRIFERSILFTPRSGLDISGSNQLGLCVQLIGQGRIKGSAGSNQSFGSSGPQCAPEDNPDIEVEKTPDGGQISVGTPAAFTIEVTNNGPGVAEDASLSDQLPLAAELNWTLGSVTKNGNAFGGCSIEPGDVLECEFGDMQVGDTFVINVSANTSASLCELPAFLDGSENLPNRANVIATNHDLVFDDGDITINCAPGTVTVPKSVNNSLDHNVQFTFRLYTGGQPVVPANLVDTKTTNAGGEGTTLVFEDLQPGTYTLCEDVPENYSSDLGGSITIGPATVCHTFVLSPGAGESIPVNNVPCPDLTPGSNGQGDPDPGGTVVIESDIAPGGGPATFTYELRGPSPATTLVDSGQIVFGTNESGTKSLTLTTPGGLIGTFTVSEDGPAKFLPNPPVDVAIAPGTDCAAQALFPHGPAPEQPAARVIKTEQLSPGATPRAARGRWTFYLIGPDGNPNGVFDPNNPGPTDTKQTNTGGRNHRINWNDLAVGDYRLCEKFFGGWKSNLGGSNAIILPNGDRCLDFSLEPNDLAVFRVNNRCPSGGRAVPR